MQEEDRIYQILDEIEENIPDSDAFSEEELSHLEEFSTHSADEIRARVAVILVDFTEEKGESILLKLTKDKDSLVRVEACDSLSSSKSYDTYKLLKKIACKDPNGMVRGYAICSLTDISKKIRRDLETSEFLLERLQKERVVFARINIYQSLYEIGHKEYLTDLLKELNAKVYRNRCAVVNILKELVNNENKQVIKDAIEERRSVEKAGSVNSSLDNLLSKIKDM